MLHLEKAEENLNREKVIGELEKRHEERIRRIFFAVFAIVSFLIIGTVFYSIIEKWSILDSLYFSTIILTTIGLGDLHPTNDVSKMFTIGYVLMGVGTVLYLLTTIAAYILEEREKEFSIRLTNLRGREIQKQVGHFGKHIIKKMRYSKKDFEEK